MVAGFGVGEGERERVARDGGSVGSRGFDEWHGIGVGEEGTGIGEGEIGGIPLDLLVGGMLGDGTLR